MTQKQLNKILHRHKAWLVGKKYGVKANLSHADLRVLDLSHADLSRIDLSHADLRHTKLYQARFDYANLEGAKFDYASWPLWCGSIGIKSIDDRLACQLLYHAICNMSPGQKTEMLKDPIAYANRFRKYQNVEEI